MRSARVSTESGRVLVGGVIRKHLSSCGHTVKICGARVGNWGVGWGGQGAERELKGLVFDGESVAGMGDSLMAQAL